jgi:hypothetical protein
MTCTKKFLEIFTYYITFADSTYNKYTLNLPQRMSWKW